MKFFLYDQRKEPQSPEAETLWGRNGIYHYEVEFANMKKTLGKLTILK